MGLHFEQSEHSRCASSKLMSCDTDVTQNTDSFIIFIVVFFTVILWRWQLKLRGAYCLHIQGKVHPADGNNTFLQNYVTRPHNHKLQNGSRHLGPIDTPRSCYNWFSSFSQLQILRVSRQYDQFVWAINYTCRRQMVWWYSNGFYILILWFTDDYSAISVHLRPFTTQYAVIVAAVR